MEADRKTYNQFVMFGGFPYIPNILNDKEMIRDYLRGIYSTIVLKDILQRKKFSDSDVLEKITKYSLSNIGNLTSSKKNKRHTNLWWKKNCQRNGRKLLRYSYRKLSVL